MSLTTQPSRRPPANTLQPAGVPQALALLLHHVSLSHSGTFLRSAVTKDILAAYRTLFDQATTTISADLFATVPLSQLALTGSNCIEWHDHRGEAMRALADAPREVLEHVTPLMLSLHPSYLGALYWRTLADRGRLDVLQWGAGAHGFRPSAEVAITAARSGQVQILQWLHENAAFCGQISVLDWLVARHDWRDGGAAACAAAAAAGELPALERLRAHGTMEWLVDAGAPVHVLRAYRHATRRGQFASLEWLEDVFDGETPWDESIFAYAAESGNLALLDSLHADGCPWDERASRKAAASGHVQVMEWLLAAAAPLALDVCDVAYSSHEDEAFEWAYGHGLPVAAKTEAEMAERGDVARLEWLHARGHAFQSPPDMWAVADFGTMRWLHKHRFPCDPRAMAAALERGDADAVRWLADEVGHGVCDYHACIAAAAGTPARGGCAWDERVCTQARVNGHLDVLKWAVRKGCPCGLADLQCLA
ncbi:hypothetical protein JKP88DRAFT_321779 [Tribonema minus]|uniref:Ankyrin repeat domain-containing protein n=1 Tax=Tribonema minus TaxID=303371 RepID=A0A835YTK1_9STRA|nr:hypothetical protein JKP88DRAFT_321779 [Tribonema minus]